MSILTYILFKKISVVSAYIIMAASVHSLDLLNDQAVQTQLFLDSLNARGGMHQKDSTYFVESASKLVKNNFSLIENPLYAERLKNITSILNEVYISMRWNLIQRIQSAYNLNINQCEALYNNNSLYRKFQADLAYRQIFIDWMQTSYNPTRGLLLDCVSTGSSTLTNGLNDILKAGASESLSKFEMYYNQNSQAINLLDNSKLSEKVKNIKEYQTIKVPDHSDIYKHKKVLLCTGGALIFFSICNKFT